MGDGMVGQKRAEVGYGGGCAAAWVHLNDLIAGVQQPMRTACTPQQRVHSMVEEGNISDATHIRPDSRTALGGGKTVYNGAPVSLRVDLGNSCRPPACIRTNGGEYLGTSPDGR